MNAPLPLRVSRESVRADTKALAAAGGEAHAQAADLASALVRHTQGEVLFDAASRGRYATDASIYQVMPIGVFVPRTTDDVDAALAIAREQQVPIVARGAGTSQCGQTVGTGLVIDFSKHLREIVRIDAQARTAVVQPGIVLDALNAALRKHGLWYPVDVSTSAQATLGGMAGNNSCGSRSIAYGNMVHNVLGLQAWLADGAVLDFGPMSAASGRALELGRLAQSLAHAHREDLRAMWPKVMRRVAGYNLDVFDCQSERPYTADGSVNLAHLLVGSEGTLALTRELTLALSALPAAKVLGVVNFPSFRGAMDAAQHIVRLAPSAVELVDRTMIDLARANPAFRPVIDAALIGEPQAILLVEFSGEERAVQQRQLDRLVELMGDLGLPGSVVPMREDPAQKALWDVRKAGLNIMMSLKGDGKPVSFIEDCAVPLAHLAEYTDALTEVFARHGTRGTWYAHASVGTLHVRPILDMRRDGAAKMRAIAEEAAVLVRRFKGAYSGEHGDGLCRGEWVQWQFGPRLTQALAQIKSAFDPANLLCPGRIVQPPRMDDPVLFRFAPGYRTIEIRTALDWSAWNVQNDARTEAISAPGTGGDTTGGFAKAVEMCNNNGHCRKFDAGTMCPSYRVTRDEQHLTRGRANTLRLALSGQLGADALSSHALRESMSLCVSCKGCKRDCPTGVDMARMKIEWLAQDRARHGFSLKDRLVARLPEYARLASRVAPLLNLRNRVPLLARLGERWLGLSARRSLPRWRADTYFATQRPCASAHEAIAAHARDGRGVLLFVDTFNGHFDSENAHAAQRVLEAAGYAVHVARKPRGHYCCGRTYLASGMVDEARTKAREMLDAMAPFIEAGVSVVGLEPSCLFTLRDEWLVMDLGEPARRLSKLALLFEEFIAREARAGRFEAKFRPLGRPLLVHGHCHQKAFGAMPAVMEALSLVPGAKPALVESSCCGMAGSFGYEAEHYEVSMQMAELSLLPAVRAAGEAIVVADGTSCRHQIADGASREAVHVARVLADALA